MYERLNTGEVINKKDEAERYGVTTKTIQRDIDEIRLYMEEKDARNPNIVYDRSLRGYLINKDRHIWLTNEEILVITKIILESRAFPCQELNILLDKLIMQCEPAQRKHIKEVIMNERYHYTAVRHNKPLTGMFWELSNAVRRQQKIQMVYQRIPVPSPVERLIEPVGIIFSEYYFYLIAYLSRENKEFPVAYRLDRILKYEILKETFYVPYARRFEEGEFRKRVQFMQAGEIMRIRFRFWGTSLEAVLDRLPTARVLAAEDGYYVIEAEVFGKGIKMWLLSQQQYLEVISPPAFREEMKQTVTEMLDNYRASAAGP